MRSYRPFFCSSAQFLPYRSQPMLQNSKELPKKLFKFLKKLLLYWKLLFRCFLCSKLPVFFFLSVT